jgi:hypothetical protein
MRRAAALLLSLASACSSSSNAPAARANGDAATDAGARDGDAGLHAVAFAHQTIRAVDVLFVVDTAPGMAPALAKLPAAFGAFDDALRSLPAGYPDLHVAVVSADLGAGRFTVGSCRPDGDRGGFWSVARGRCTGTGLPPTQGFFAIGGGASNFASSLSLGDALACVAPAGDATDPPGCEFPHPFAAALRALGADGTPAPPENEGFLRPDAFLAIVLVTNQDDCSAPPDTDLFDPSSTVVADPLGPLTSFRCAERGLLCGGVAPSRTKAGPLTGCQSAEDGVLVRVSDAVARLRALKSNPNMVLVAALAGPADPFAVELDAPGVPGDAPWPRLAASCTSDDGLVSARPGVRVEQWVYAFGHNGVLARACDDFAPSLATIATTIASVLGPPCLTGRFAQVAGPHGARPDCTIVDYPAAGGAGTPLPSCVDTDGAAPCWTLTDDAACPGGQRLDFETPPGLPTVGANSAVQCEVCDDATDPHCR